VAHLASRHARGGGHDMSGRPARPAGPAPPRPPGGGTEADPEQRRGDLGGGGGGGAVEEAPLVLPARDGLRLVGVRSAGRSPPGMLTEQQQIAPHFPTRRRPLLAPGGAAAAPQ